MDKKEFPLWGLIYRNLIFIIICMIVGAGAFGVYNKIKKEPVFVASKQVILSAVLDVTQEATTSSSQTNESLAKILLPSISIDLKTVDAVSIMNKDYRANAQGKYKYSNGYISAGAIGISYSDTNLLFKISYSDVNKEVAIERLNYIVDNFSKVFEEYENKSSQLLPAGRVDIISVQNSISVTSSSSLKRYIIIGAAAGIGLSLFYIILRYLLDNKVKTEEEIIDLTGESVMAFLEK